MSYIFKRIKSASGSMPYEINEVYIMAWCIFILMKNIFCKPNFFSYYLRDRHPLIKNFNLEEVSLCHIFSLHHDYKA